ncbi:MAG: DNA-binding protein [Gemmatimonadota bacterium]
MSFDGYVAAPDQSVDNPIGVAGCNLHAWAFALEAFRSRFGMDGGEVNARTAVIEESLVNIGAPIMGRNIFGGHPGG